MINPSRPKQYRDIPFFQTLKTETRPRHSKKTSQDCFQTETLKIKTTSAFLTITHSPSRQRRLTTLEPGCREGSTLTTKRWWSRAISPQITSDTSSSWIDVSSDVSSTQRRFNGGLSVLAVQHHRVTITDQIPLQTRMVSNNNTVITRLCHSRAQTMRAPINFSLQRQLWRQRSTVAKI